MTVRVASGSQPFTGRRFRLGTTDADNEIVAAEVAILGAKTVDGTVDGKPTGFAQNAMLKAA